MNEQRKEKIKYLRNIRRVLKRLVQEIDDEELTPDCREYTRRFQAIGTLLTIAMEWPINPLLIKASLALQCYETSVARAYLAQAIDNLRTNIKRLKRERGR